MKHYSAKKRFGQNFLHDEYIIERITQLINPQCTDCMVEIGPGLGALTRPLLEHLHTLHVIELDRDLVDRLQQTFHTDISQHKLVVHADDALKFDYNFREATRQNVIVIRVVGNLPYNISTPLLFYLSNFPNIHDMHFMLQQEVVERICATPNNKNYGRLSVMLQYRYNCSNLLQVGKEAFTPSPQVNSAIIRLTPKTSDLWQHIDHARLSHIVTTAFNTRRKTIANNLKNLFTPNQLRELNIDPQARAENLTIADYANLAVQQ